MKKRAVGCLLICGVLALAIMSTWGYINCLNHPADYEGSMIPREFMFGTILGWTIFVSMLAAGLGGSDGTDEQTEKSPEENTAVAVSGEGASNIVTSYTSKE